MFSIKAGKITTPMVKTSIDGGLGVDDYAEICTFKIISVSESAPPVIKEQAKYFKNKVKDVIRTYIEQAVAEERNKCVDICAKGGHEDAANILRRI